MTSVTVPEMDQQTRYDLTLECESQRCALDATWALTVVCPKCAATRTYLICDDHRQAAHPWLRKRVKHGKCSWSGFASFVSEVPL